MKYILLFGFILLCSQKIVAQVHDSTIWERDYAETEQIFVKFKEYRKRDTNDNCERYSWSWGHYDSLVNEWEKRAAIIQNTADLSDTEKSELSTRDYWDLFSQCHEHVRSREIFTKGIFVENNDTLRYRLLYPPNYDGNTKYPLVVFLHGSGVRGSDNERQLTNVPGIFTNRAFRLQYPCFLLAPQCAQNDVWVNFPNFPVSLKATDTPTVSGRLTLALIEKLAQLASVNNKRIYLTGYSMGGEGTFDLLARKPGLFAAAIPVCSVSDTAHALLIKDIPIWVFHGSKDEVNNVQYSRLMVDALKRAGGIVQYTEYPGEGHRIWPKVYAESELFAWLFSQAR